MRIGNICSRQILHNHNMFTQIIQIIRNHLISIKSSILMDNILVRIPKRCITTARNIKRMGIVLPYLSKININLSCNNHKINYIRFLIIMVRQCLISQIINFTKSINKIKKMIFKTKPTHLLVILLKTDIQPFKMETLVNKMHQS